MTTTQQHQLNTCTVYAYRAIKQYAPMTKYHYLLCEWIILDEDGEVYTSMRMAGGTSVQFRTVFGKFVTVGGFDRLPVSMMERHASTITEDDLNQLMVSHSQRMVTR
jgi:hypothetical protein